MVGVGRRRRKEHGGGHAAVETIVVLRSSDVEIEGECLYLPPLRVPSRVLERRAYIDCPALRTAVFPSAGPRCSRQAIRTTRSWATPEVYRCSQLKRSTMVTTDLLDVVSHTGGGFAAESPDNNRGKPPSRAFDADGLQSLPRNSSVVCPPDTSPSLVLEVELESVCSSVSGSHSPSPDPWVS